MEGHTVEATERARLGVDGAQPYLHRIGLNGMRFDDRRPSLLRPRATLLIPAPACGRRKLAGSTD